MSELHATKVVRLYADDFGESRFESLTIPMSPKEFAPPAAPVHVTEPRPTQHFVVIELPMPRLPSVLLARTRGAFG